MEADGPPLLPYGFAKRHGVVLLGMDEVAHVALRDGADPLALVEARRALGRALKIHTLPRAEFERRLSEAYADDGLSAGGSDDLDMPGGLDSLAEDIPAAADLLDSQDDAPIIRLINGVIAEAIRRGASDVHVEPFETALIIRLRIDGVLREVLSLSHRLSPLIVSRIKVMARLDIAERRTPQDGRISLALGGRSLDVRVSTLPSRAGERVVMRILDQEQAGIPLPELG
ncbi:MAG: ATPase, T2SS/T4P/T4SS family, partial [Phenylobacterium sp.]|nr:ATPase, T2SS/T4P/T4SS family [Phenylobacterium sp.]